MNLYDGTGDPWAGHARLNGSDAGFVRTKLSESMENFGTDPPIGSIIMIIFCNILEFVNVGMTLILELFVYNP